MWLILSKSIYNYKNSILWGILHINILWYTHKRLTGSTRCTINCFVETVLCQRKMALLLSKNYFSFQIKRCFQRQQFSGVYTWYGIEWKCGKRILRNVLSVLVGASATCGAFLYFLDRSVQAMGHIAHLPSYPWDFEGYLTSLDHSAVRRGWQVYRTICHTCHSLRYVRFMDLIDVSHTKDEVKAIAAEYEVDSRPEFISCPPYWFHFWGISFPSLSCSFCNWLQVRARKHVIQLQIGLTKMFRPRKNEITTIPCSTKFTFLFNVITK